MKNTNFLRLAAMLVLSFAAVGQSIFAQQNKPDFEKAMRFVKEKVNVLGRTCSKNRISFDYEGHNVTESFYGFGGNQTMKYSLEDIDSNRVEVSTANCPDTDLTVFLRIHTIGDKKRITGMGNGKNH